MSDSNQTNNGGDWKNREIGALWLKKSASGTKYLSGHIETGENDDIDSEKTRVIVFANKDKKNDRAPDYRMYLSETPQSSGKSKESSATETQDVVEEDEELDVL